MAAEKLRGPRPWPLLPVCVGKAGQRGCAVCAEAWCKALLEGSALLRVLL